MVSSSRGSPARPVTSTYVTEYAADYELVLFYSSKHRLVMQYAQNS